MTLNHNSRLHFGTFPSILFQRILCVFASPLAV